MDTDLMNSIRGTACHAATPRDPDEIGSIHADAGNSRDSRRKQSS